VHELSVASAVVDTATRHARGRRVTVVQLRVGHLRQVMPDSLAFYFEHVAVGTVCEGARLEVEVVPARLGCAACGHAWELDAPVFRCPRCDETDVRVTAGDELEVESIEVEELEEACIAPR
jgi:hydrogenase nickel incorporation protein HypA/HybF